MVMVWEIQVTHSLGGLQILRNFVVGVVGAPTDWNMADIAEEFIREVRPWPHGSKILDRIFDLRMAADRSKL